jgi:hypothetical protein
MREEPFLVSYVNKQGIILEVRKIEFQSSGGFFRCSLGQRGLASARIACLPSFAVCSVSSRAAVGCGGRAVGGGDDFCIYLLSKTLSADAEFTTARGHEALVCVWQSASARLALTLVARFADYRCVLPWKVPGWLRHERPGACLDRVACNSFSCAFSTPSLSPSLPISSTSSTCACTQLSTRACSPSPCQSGFKRRSTVDELLHRSVRPPPAHHVHRRGDSAADADAGACPRLLTTDASRRRC